MTEKKDNQQNLYDDLLATPFSNEDTAATTATPQTNVNQSLDKLSPEQRKQAEALATQIDTKNQTAVLNYGANAQKKLSEFSQQMLNSVQSQQTGEIGGALTDLMYRLNEANPSELRAEDSNVFRKLFGKVKRSVYEITAKYQKIGAQIDTIGTRLDHQKNELLVDNKMLDGLYDQNKDYFDALNVYIAAGKVKLQDLQERQIPQLLAAAEKSGDQMQVQEANDLKQFADRLEKRTHDLELARQITIQQAPQIRLIQGTNQALAEKIQASINTAIPLWKNQVAIALTLLRQKDAVTAQRQVSQTTNDLLTKNSEMLKISAIETAKENERGVVDIETLQKTQNDLIETLQETLKIQQEGHTKRQHAEVELQKMEDELKNHLLAYSHGTTSDGSTYRKDVTDTNH
ncbi:toxic anion resistance protein [Lapidilactobacillus bayanensis]|uniref:toxic anion resistance protein n=1 Tax=Lapidilactobacillus bayanensis TaxID=2485998 RepID=UPI000F7698DF|nr:toxic anion resistance protein [Lapidilactobacillus bayanensis]